MRTRAWGKCPKFTAGVRVLVVGTHAGMPHRPLVLTLALGEATMARFSRERAELFPAGRTRVDAHLTLFHALPGALREEVESELDDLAGTVRPAAEVTGVRSLGRGVAYVVRCPVVERLRAEWAERWAAHLTRQDAQSARLHVTVQNKVEAEVARRTHAELERAFTPWETTAVAVRLWRYDGGPWTHLADGPFGG